MGDTPESSPAPSQKRSFSQLDSEAVSVSGSTSSTGDLVSQAVEPDAKRLCTDVFPVDPFMASSSFQNAQLAAGPPQRRRVNPESLAARLGPELVAELEKHITPGDIEMPPFSVRRDIQVKFGIDRRHIYDFFHSRGLRCLKDEKGPKKESALLQEFRFRPPRQLPTPPSPKMPAMRKRRAATAATASLSKTTTTRAPRKSKTLPSKPVITIANMDVDDDDGPITPFEPYSSPSRIELTEEDMFADFIPAANPLDETFSLERALGDVSYAYRSKPVFERMVELQELSSLASTPALTPSSSVSSFVSSPDLASVSPTTPATADLTTQSKAANAPLSQAEREDYYGWMSGVLGPAVGIQENVGTYRSYMAKQRGIYFERLLFSDGRSNSVSSSKRAPSGGDFRNWVVRSRPDLPSPILPTIITPAATDRKDVSLVLDDLLVSNPVTDDLEGLFPDLDLVYPDDRLEPEEHLDSPVLHRVVLSAENGLEKTRLSIQSPCRRKFGLKSDARARCISGCPSHRRKRKMTSSLPVIDQDWAQRAHRRTYSVTGEM